MKFTPTILITSLLAAGLALQAPLRAETHDGKDNDHSRGGEVAGSEHLEQKIRLTATVDAPAGAKGRAELEAKNNHGVSTAKLDLEVEGLVDGIYTVTVTSLADATPTVLGTFEVTTAPAGGDNSEDETETESDNEKDHPADASHASGTGTHHDESDKSESKIVFGGKHGVPFPAGFNPLDIGGLSIADANGVVLLQGSFADVGTLQTSSFVANIAIEPGDAATAATGGATLRARVIRKTLVQRFALAAHHLPKSANLTLTVNGVQTAAVRTNAKGNLAVTRLPKGVIGHRIVTIAVDDADGQRVLSAHF